jgi:hypothetical protein
MIGVRIGILAGRLLYRLSEVGPRTERLVAGPGRDDRSHALVAVGFVKRTRAGPHHLGCQGVVLFGAIERDVGDRFVDLVTNAVGIHCALP